MALCIECGLALPNPQKYYSLENFGVPLCMEHQNYIRDMANRSTVETIGLYLALRKRGVPAELEKFDGFKTIDIAVVDARINIEVDGSQHHFNPSQAFRDLQRTYYSFLKGYITLHIPNSLIHNDLEQTADWLTEICIESKNKNNRQWGRYA